MKRKLYSSVLLAVLVSSCVVILFEFEPVKADGETVNVVSNFSFESGFSDWTVTYSSYGYDPEISDYVAHDGSYSCRQGYGGGAMRKYLITQSIPNIDSDQVEEIYAWFYRGLNPNYAYLLITYEDESVDGGTFSLSSAETWMKKSVTPDADKIIVAITVGQYEVDTSYLDMNDRAYVDDVHIEVAGGYVTADLEPDDSGQDWVFTDWRYYTFRAEIPSYAYSGDVSAVYIGFTEIFTGNGTVGFSAWSNGSFWDSSFNVVYADRDLEPIRLQAGEWSNSSGETTVTFKLWFTKKCLDLYLDEDAVDVLLWYNDTSAAESGWLNVNPNYFRVYTDGGFSQVADETGDAGVLPGGRDFNMFAYNDSYTFKDLYWRDLVHIKLVPEIQFYAGYQYFQLNWGFDYVLRDGGYSPGLHLQLEPSAVSYTGVFASNVWINYTASWYVNNTLIKEEDLYAFYHGEVYNQGDAGRVKFYIDLWFDEGNASSVQGGRINAYEFPMKDSSGAWFRWLSSNWGVKDDVLKQSECLVDIFEYGEGAVTSENIEMVRVWSSLSVTSGAYDQFVAVINYDVFDTTFSEEKGVIKGVSTPPWDETNMPAMRNTGVLGAVWSMFQGIGAWIGENIIFGGLNLWGTFVAFLDTIAGWLGAPYFFTNLFNWLGETFEGMLIGASYAWEVVANIFVLIASLIGVFVTTVTELVLSFASFITNLAEFMGGGLGAAANLWETFGISTWITVAIIFYPLYLIILWENKGMGAVIEQLTWIFGLLVWLYHFFEGLIMGAVNLVSSLIESIPVAE